jgi:probable phosphoglycerate mutase
VQGRGVNADLNDKGRAQAAAFFEKYKDVPFDKIYTSKLKRTHQTVQPFIDKGIAWEQLDGLDELAWGIWEGKPNTEEAIQAFQGIMDRWQAQDYDASFEGGESPNAVVIRQKEALEVIKNAADEKTVLICMHGRAMRLLFCVLMDLPLCEMTRFPHHNTTLYKVSYTDGKFDIIDYNNIEHLTADLK